MSHDDLAEDPRVMQAARDFLADLEAGRAPDRVAYLARYPELAEALAECLEGIEMAHASAQALRSETGPGEYPVEPLGDFQIIREIGRGGMGVVYEAVQRSLGRRVALKVLPFASALDAKHLQRFKTEAQAAAQLHHTNIVPVHAVGCERGVHFYAMQLIEGRSLETVIQELRGDPPSSPGDNLAGATVDLALGAVTGPPAPRLSWTEGSQRSSAAREQFRTATRIALQVAEALEYAHEAGVIHRDIKPANLLLDARGTVWVTDFGLAQVAAEVHLTQTGDVVGTLRYMSPEQAAGRRAEIDSRTDVYSLGATLYELLTLEPLFAGTDRQGLLRLILETEPIPPRHRDRTIPVDLETIVLKAVTKAPSDRYASAGAMAADLRRFLEERPILARRPTLVDRVRKWMRRHPSVVGAAIVLLGVSAMGFAVSTALIAREQARTLESYDREKERAREAEERFQLARRAADELISAAEEINDNPAHESMRKRLLEAALDYYQEFIKLRGENSDADLEDTRDRVKTILSDLAALQQDRQFKLLREADVLNDIKTTARQRHDLKEIRDNQERERNTRFQDLTRRLSPEERRQEMLREAHATESALEQILTPTQRVRLRQISLQCQGPLAVQDTHLARDLRLSTNQKEQIRGIVSDMFFGLGDRSPPIVGPGGGRAESSHRPENLQQMMQQMMQQTMQMTLKKIRGTLTPQQASVLDEALGPPYMGAMPMVMPFRDGPGKPRGFDGHRGKPNGPFGGGKSLE